MSGNNCIRGQNCCEKQRKYLKLPQRDINYIKASLRELENCMLPNETRKEIQNLYKLVDSLYIMQN